jgi:UDP-3-O-[3-hydroxymyristoyl] glucosamine N-acyltransferase
MEFSAKAIAELINGKIEGDDNVIVTNVSKIEEGLPGTLSFLANPKYTCFIYTTKSSIVIVDNDFIPDKEISPTLIRVSEPYKAFASLLEFYANNKIEKKGIDSLAFIGKNALIGIDAYVGAFSYISSNSVVGDNVKIYPQVYVGENVKIGKNTILYPGVKIYYDCVIGENCIIHAGTVIGSDGFGFAPNINNDYKKIPQVGNVVIENNVEIGANTTIDRATMGSTFIRNGVKLDNLIQVAHNVEIGENTVIAAQTGISGSTTLGKDMMIGGQVGFAGHLKVADEVKIGAQSGINSNINKKGEIIFGSPAFEIKKYQKSAAIFKNLPDLRLKIFELEREIQKIKKQIIIPE